MHCCFCFVMEASCVGPGQLDFGHCLYVYISAPTIGDTFRNQCLFTQSFIRSFPALLFSPGLAVLDPAMITVFSPLMFLEATTVASDKDSLHVPLSPFSSEYFIAYVAVWVVASFLCCLI